MKKIRNALPGIFFLIFIPILLFFCLDLLFPLEVKIRYSQVIYDRDEQILHAYLNKDDKWRFRCAAEEIIEDLRKALIEKEDKYFYYHPGLNPVAMTRALFNNIIAGRKTSGASTITMQVARLLHPGSRSYVNKITEMFRALQLELRYTKDEILQMYLNLLPYGSNIEGVKSASVLYFGRTPERLSLAQIVTLTIIPNRPTSLYPGKDPNLLIQERNKWLKRFGAEGIFPAQRIEDAMNEPLNANRRPAPRKAHHLCQRLHSTYRDSVDLYSTINLETQLTVENIVKNYSRRLKSMDIHNAAVIVIDNSSHEVKAYVGSQDPHDEQYAGQVDGIRAIRSPGSTLKPLIYAIAMDKGLLTPKTMITDVPTNFSGYAPENFDRKFNGKVNVEKALAYSLNVPAVKTLESIGVPALIEVLKKAGFAKVAAQEKVLGLSLALGGCGVTLEELATLFSGLANNGEVVKPSFLKNPPEQIPVSIISPSAAYMTTEILTQITRPDLPNNFKSSYSVPKVAWKTGTSYGRRDAWSIGYNKKYTIAVWVGNFSGEGVPELTGADIATPLLFELFNTLDHRSPDNWFTRPKEICFRYVCPESGLPPGELCTTEVMDLFIPKLSPPVKCEHMRYLFTDIEAKHHYCTECLPDAGYVRKAYPNLPPELLAYYRKEMITTPFVPPHNPHCSRIFVENAPVIVMPLDGKEYFIEKGEETEIILQCHVQHDIKKVFWYINDKFYKEARATETVFFKPQSGETKISCVDEKGRTSNIKVMVRYY